MLVDEWIEVSIITELQSKDDVIWSLKSIEEVDQVRTVNWKQNLFLVL